MTYSNSDFEFRGEQIRVHVYVLEDIHTHQNRSSWGAKGKRSKMKILTKNKKIAIN